MKTFATTTFAFALLGLSACKGGGGDAAKFIPEAATIVGGIDLAGVQGTQSWKDNKAMVEAQGKEALDAMNGCNLGLDKWKSVTFGTDPAGGNEKFAAVVVADGLGKKENLDCAAGKMKEKNGGKDPWTAEDEGKTLKMEDGAVAYDVLGQKDFFSALPNPPDVSSKLAQLSSPGGLAAVGNQLFIADTLNNRLVVRAVPEP